MHKRKSILIFAVLSFFFFITNCFGGTTWQNKDLCFSTKWPHEISDLRPDPRLIFGRLSNGFRYVLMKNQEPRDRVGMYLDVQAGSLNETDKQRGIAHFVEHMVFNGSTHFQPGELIDYFQSLGMSFGGDTNARTGYDSTVYNIILPNGSEKEIDKGLLVFSDYAGGALLLQGQIDKERGVILSEKRSRDSAAYRTRVATSRFALKGTMFPKRFPIGKPDIIEKANHNLLESYYRSWYRPEDMILVMVGDFDPAQVQPLINKRFSSFTGAGPRPACPEIGQVHHTGLDTFYHYEPETGSTKITVETLWNQQEKNDSLANEIKDLKMALAATMINHRLEKLAENPKTPFTDSGYSMGFMFRKIGYGTISATTSPEKWQAALKTIEHTLRQALEFGFSEDEFNRVKKEFKTALDSAVLKESTRSSMSLAGEITYDLNDNSVFQSATQQKEIFEPIVDKMSLPDVQKSLNEVWGHKNRLVEVTGNAKIVDKNPKARIEEVYKASLKETVQPNAIQEKVDFPYLKPNMEPVQPVSDIPLTSVGGERLVLSDGVILNLKKTDFKKNAFSIRVDFGHGKQTESIPGLAMLAQSVVNGSGSGRLTESELERVLTGSTVNLHFRVNKSSFSWNGGAVTKDMELLFQVLQTKLVDPGIRSDAYLVAMENIKQMYSNLERNINAGIALHIKKFLAGGYPHAGLPPLQEVSRIPLAEVRDWLLPAITTSPLEISVVGDFDRDRLVALVEKYFGGETGRTSLSEPKKVKITFPEGKKMQVTVDSSIDKAIVVVAWPTADFWNIRRTRRLNVLASIFTDRLRKEVRERLGAAYSPEVFNASSRIFPGYGVLQAIVIVDPSSIAQIKDVILKIGDDLLRHGCTTEELQRAKAPTLTAIKDMVRTNDYWLNTVLALSYRHPQQLEWPTTIVDDFESISTQDIDELAKEYLAGERSATAIIKPEKTKKTH